MALPAHLLEAKRRIEEASKQEKPEVKTESEAPVEQVQEPVVEAAAPEPQVDEEFVSIEPQDDGPQEPSPEPEQKAQPSAEVDALKKEAAQYKARWETLQGKFRQSEERAQALALELTKANGEAETLRSKVSELEKQIRQLTRKKLSDKIQESLSEEEMAIHGDAIPVFKKLADQIESDRNEEIEELKKGLEEQRKAVSETAAQAEVRAFHSAFRARVPDAEKINADQSWHAFLAKKDSLSGRLIQSIWDAHVNAMNVDGLVKVIEAWRKTQQASKTPVAPKTPSLSAAAPQPQFTEKGRFKYSDFKRASEAYRQNMRDPATKKSYEEAKRRFDDAKDRGLVDYAA